MTIKVKVENPIDARIKLKARKTLDGNILILDHPEIDIVLAPKKKKVLALSKHQYSDHMPRSRDFLTTLAKMEWWTPGPFTVGMYTVLWRQ